MSNLLFKNTSNKFVVSLPILTSGLRLTIPKESEQVVSKTELVKDYDKVTVRFKSILEVTETDPDASTKFPVPEKDPSEEITEESKVIADGSEPEDVPSDVADPKEPAPLIGDETSQEQDFNYNREELEALSKPELNKLAKAHGISTRLSQDNIISALLES